MYHLPTIVCSLFACLVGCAQKEDARVELVESVEISQSDSDSIAFHKYLQRRKVRLSSDQERVLVELCTEMHHGPTEYSQIDDVEKHRFASLNSVADGAHSVYDLHTLLMQFVASVGRCFPGQRAGE